MEQYTIIIFLESMSNWICRIKQETETEITVDKLVPLITTISAYGPSMGLGYPLPFINNSSVLSQEKKISKDAIIRISLADVEQGAVIFEKYIEFTSGLILPSTKLSK